MRYIEITGGSENYDFGTEVSLVKDSASEEYVNNYAREWAEVELFNRYFNFDYDTAEEAEEAEDDYIQECFSIWVEWKEISEEEYITDYC
jgi:hypothetical protein